jgi:hypothetical protein
MTETDFLHIIHGISISISIPRSLRDNMHKHTVYSVCLPLSHKGFIGFIRNLRFWDGLTGYGHGMASWIDCFIWHDAELGLIDDKE